MNLVSVRLITDDVKRLVAFYERALRTPASWSTDDFAEIRTPTGTLAIGSTRTVGLFGPGAARPADNHTAIIEFLVADVDAEYARLSPGSPMSSPCQQPCPGATGPCWCATPTVLCSTSSHP
ncbi:VOC family protein [Cryobacterium sp. 10C3]|uniref:VOC family protein n=1 Tax=Cryobacterium sp. 10C3 TaxID=3048577 RepID=UPI002AB51C1C|nr:VOC family protein [Cryobacterium sp. 10C3]MDY7556207.1 VOC family protein [Cryobacterium sp. 10C3]